MSKEGVGGRCEGWSDFHSLSAGRPPHSRLGERHKGQRGLGGRRHSALRLVPLPLCRQVRHKRCIALWLLCSTRQGGSERLSAGPQQGSCRQQRLPASALVARLQASAGARQATQQQQQGACVSTTLAACRKLPLARSPWRTAAACSAGSQSFHTQGAMSISPVPQLQGAWERCCSFRPPSAATAAGACRGLCAPLRC